jgi:hypothetical protein
MFIQTIFSPDLAPVPSPSGRLLPKIFICSLFCCFRLSLVDFELPLYSRYWCVCIGPSCCHRRSQSEFKFFVLFCHSDFGFRAWSRFSRLLVLFAISDCVLLWNPRFQSLLCCFSFVPAPVVPCVLRSDYSSFLLSKTVPVF